MRYSTSSLLILLAACSDPHPQQPPFGEKADRIVVVKEQRWLTAYARDREIITYFNIEFDGDVESPTRFRSDGRIPEGVYVIKRQNVDEANGLALRLSYPNPANRASARGRMSNSDFFIYSSPTLPRFAVARRPGAGGIRLRDDEMMQLSAIVADGTPLTIEP